MALKAMSKKKPVGAAQTTNDKLVAGWRDRIEKTMKAERLSMRKLGILAGLGSTTIRHTLTQAETITLDSLRRIANAMGTSVVYLSFGVGAVEGGGDVARGVRVLPIFGPDDAHKDVPDVDRGYVAVPQAKYPADTKALLVTNTAMTVEGMNAPVPPACVVLQGDVVLFAPSQRAQPGGLCVYLKSGDPALSIR